MIVHCLDTLSVFVLCRLWYDPRCKRRDACIAWRLIHVSDFRQITSWVMCVHEGTLSTVFHLTTLMWTSHLREVKRLERRSFADMWTMGGPATVDKHLVDSGPCPCIERRRHFQSLKEKNSYTVDPFLHRTFLWIARHYATTPDGTCPPDQIEKEFKNVICI